MHLYETKFLVRSGVLSGKWGLLNDNKRDFEPKQIQLLTSFHRKRYGRLMFSLDLPFPEKPPEPEPVNIIQEALQAKTYMKAHPDETYLSAARKLNFHRKRISKLLSMIDMLPPGFIEKAKNCSDRHLLHNINHSNINRILCHPCPRTIEEKLNALLTPVNSIK